MENLDELAVQVLSDEGAQCGDCADQPGDRTCPDCEKCRRRYVASLRAAGWAPAERSSCRSTRPATNSPPSKRNSPT